MSEENRREFMKTMLGMGAAIGGLTLADPAMANVSRQQEQEKFAPYWQENYNGYELWDVFHFGLGDTHLFAHGIGCVDPTSDKISWYIRCENTFRPGDLFVGYHADAKKMAERFTFETLTANVVAVEKVAFALKRQ